MNAPFFFVDKVFRYGIYVSDADYCRDVLRPPPELDTWSTGRTIMLRGTSKRVKEVVDKMRLPVVVHLNRSFWDDVRNDTVAEKLQFMMRNESDPIDDNLVTHQNTRSVALLHERTRYRETWKSAGKVPRAGAP